MAHRQSLAGLLLFPLAAGIFAQQPPAAPSQSSAPPQTSIAPTLKVKTQLTVEDVTVTDVKDKPVHGLTEPDFTVKEDGKPQTIKNFQEYSAQPPQGPQVPPPHLPPNVYTNQQAAAPNAYNILLFDNVATGLTDGLVRAPENLMLSQQQAIKYLKAMPDGTQVAILQLATGLHVVQGFTPDRDLLLAAVGSLKAEAVHGTFVFGDPPSLTDICQAANTQSQMTTDALAEVATFVSRVKGRKNLIWFTPGIPWLTTYGLHKVAIPIPPWLTDQADSGLQPRLSSPGSACVVDYTPQLQKTYGLLRAARVAVYPVDPRGLASWRGQRNFNAWSLNLTKDKGSIEDVAEATGGKAYFNRNDLDAEIGEAIATGSDFYSLSYVPPPSKSDGKYHSIKVNVDRPGLHLLYREGYIASDYAPPKEDKKNLPRPASPDSNFLAAMAHGLPDATDLLFGVSVLPSTAPAKPGSASDTDASQFLNPKLKGKPLVRYDIAYALPAGAITLVGAPSGPRTGSFKIAVLAYDADGEQLNSENKESTYNVKPDQVAQFLGQPSRLDVQVDLPPGKVFLRVGVLDIPSQKMGVLEIPQTVAAAK